MHPRQPAQTISTPHTTFTRFDAAELLDSQEAIVEFISLALEEDDPDTLLKSLGLVARAKGMGKVAHASGLNRESVYKALSEGAQPRFNTISKVLKSLGLRLTVQPIPTSA